MGVDNSPVKLYVEYRITLETTLRQFKGLFKNEDDDCVGPSKGEKIALALPKDRPCRN